MIENVAETILLTGAGFSHNFGGFLAEEMWAEIFNHPKVKKQTSLRKMMLRNFDYESIYEEVLYKSKYSAEEKEAIRNAVYEAYNNLDNSIRTFHNSVYLKEDIYNDIQELFKWFAYDKNTISFFFTLNQDIFVERCYQSAKSLKLPGRCLRGLDERDLCEIPERAVSDKWNYSLGEKAFLTLKTELDESSIISSLSKNEFNYIKLHGSFNWRSSDGSKAMVIGMNKEEQIYKESLLKCYFEIFREVLCCPNRKLLVIGYGFRDKHVNQIIADAIDKHGLRLFVLSPESPQQFIDKFYDKRGITDYYSQEYPRGKDILKGLTGYYPFEMNKGLNKTVIESLRTKITQSAL